MLLCFVLSMPSNNAWNGRWTGEGNLYAKIWSTGKSVVYKQRALEIIQTGHFVYNFGDGWVARIDVREISGQEAKTVRRKTKGFCGYDWMVDSILKHLEIRA